jgi:microcystin-dependent protein
MEPFIGQIMMFAGNFAPRGWATCDGQLLAISSNSALFSLLGTTYGGDGRTTFGLPDLRGRVPMHAGSGPGLSPRRLGEKGGAETVTLTVAQLPSHNHGVTASAPPADARIPTGKRPASTEGASYGAGQAAAMAADMVTPTGGSQAHDNMPPFGCINYVIALQGVYPSRN